MYHHLLLKDQCFAGADPASKGTGKAVKHTDFNREYYHYTLTI
jgi:hypothetical protein